MRILTITLLLSLTFVSISCAQSSSNQMSDLVQTKGITTPVHKANIGKITFAKGIFPLKEYKESDFLSSFEIKENGDLNFIAFLDNSLTNYLHQLAPTLTVDELVQKGNFQFSFYVDGNLLYTENLNQGAGLPYQKNEHTILHKPLLSSINADSWGRFLWMRFYFRSGGEAALETGTHLLKIELRPYLEHNEIIVGDIIAEGEISLKLAEPEKVSEEQVAIQKIQPNSGWEISSDSYDIDKIRALNEKIVQNRFKSITSIIVIKNGELLIEEYFNGANRNTLHDTRSVGKSFASTITGLAIKDGYLKSTDQTLSEFYDLRKFSNYSPKKDEVTIKSLLTMSSGFDGTDSDYNSPGNEDRMQRSNNWINYALDLPMDNAKRIGEKWDYFTAGVLILGDILDKSVPEGLEKYADKKLFKPLGISNYIWFYTPQNAPYTGGGLEMSALDFAKFGQLYKNNGNWNGNQILSSEWVEKTFTNYFVDTPDQTPYGFLFWNQLFSANNRTHKAFLSNGNGGNKIVVFNEQPLVIVVTATAYGQPYGHSQVEQIIERYILPAVLE